MVAVKIMSAYLAIFLVLLCLVWFKYVYHRHRQTLGKSLNHVVNVSANNSEAGGAEIRALVVTAHPDDECMFFAPGIIRLGELKASLYLLCLSEGTATARQCKLC